MTLSECIGPAVRRRRLLLGISQSELSRRLGTHRPLVSRVEAGRHSITIETLERYAEALGCKASALLASAEQLLERGDELPELPKQVAV